MIIGWAVFSKDIRDAAMYNLNQKDEAFDAAKRWGASIIALVLHPDAPVPQVPTPEKQP
jgi:hypothetical protein